LPHIERVQPNCCHSGLIHCIARARRQHFMVGQGERV
jgi:hypothetical protein